MNKILELVVFSQDLLVTLANVPKPVGIIYKQCSCRPDQVTNMAAIGNSCFWLVDF